MASRFIIQADFAVVLLLILLSAAHNSDDLARHAFEEDVATMESALARVQKTLGDNGNLDFESVAWAGIWETAKSGYGAWTAAEIVNSASDMMADTAGLEGKLKVAQEYGGQALDAAIDSAKQYSRKWGSKTGNRYVGEFAKVDQLSKMRKEVKAQVDIARESGAQHAKYIREAMTEVNEHKQALTDSVRNAARWAGFTAFVSLAQSANRCFSAVLAHSEHVGKQAEWAGMIHEWREKLVENRNAMKDILATYFETKEWDLSAITSLTLTSNEIFAEVRSFNTELIGMKKTSNSIWVNSVSGGLVNIFNAGLNVLQFWTMGALDTLGFVAGGVLHSVGFSLDVYAAYHASLDVHELDKVLLHGEVILREATSQVEVLKKANTIIRRLLKGGKKGSVPRGGDRPAGDRSEL